MGTILFVALASFFFGLYVAPKMIMQRFLARLRVRTIHHRMGRGVVLIEEVRG